MAEEYRPKLETYVGATGRALSINIKDRDGTAKDLSGASSVTISARDGGADGTVIANAEALTAVDASAGQFTWTPSSGAVDTAGKFDCMVMFVEDGTTDYAEPMFFVVKAPIVGSA